MDILLKDIEKFIVLSKDDKYVFIIKQKNREIMKKFLLSIFFTFTILSSNEVKKVEVSENRDLKTIQEKIISLKNEIELLKKEINLTLEKKNKKVILKTNQKIVNSSLANIYSKPNQNSKIVTVLRKDSTVLIESCDKYGWCKLSNKEEYIKEFLLR